MTSGPVAWVSSSVASISRGFAARAAGPCGACDFLPPTRWSYLRPDVSFFDEDDEPRRAPRPRRAAGGDVAADSQTLLIRRAVAGVVVVLVLLLLVFVIKGCRSSQHESALKDYNSQVSSIAGESSRAVGSQFFQLLDQGGSESPQDLQTQISGFRVQADQQLKQAENLSVPDDMRGAQQSFLNTLE